MSHALEDGEDYELLFAIPKTKISIFETAWKKRFVLRCTRIGCMTDCRSGSVILSQQGKIRRRLKDGGYEHYKNM